MTMKLFSIEGNSQRLDGGAMFGNVPRALWQRWLEPDERNRIGLSCRALLVENLNGLTVLFETGIGSFFEPKLKDRFGVLEQDHVLLKSLEACGHSHESVDAVVISHLHFDHAGGLLAPYQENKEAELLFPNARFIVGQECWKRALNPHARDRASFIPALNRLLEQSGRLEIICGSSSETLGDSVSFSFSDGHTPGLMLSEIGGDGGVVFCSDLIPGRPWVHVPVTMGYDRYPELIINEKQRFLEDKMRRGVRLYFTHDPECAMASVSQSERGRFGVEQEFSELAGLELAAPS
jgi:glyoxylase-like metal-dependent hydrolase (beta-lactamase superfamily II)